MWATASLAVLCALSGSLALPPSPSSTTTPTPTSTPTPAPAPSPTPTPAATAAAADSTAAETTLHRAPWQQTVPDAPGKAASGDVEIIRSIELDLVFDDNENGSHSNSSSAVSERLNEYGGGRVDTSRFKPSPAIPFRPEDVLLATSSDVNHIPCKEIRTRSIPKESEPENDFDFPSRLLLGRVLLRGRAGDSAESASVRQSRVLDFQPIHTSKNDYPAETVPRRTATAAAAARRLAARTRARNLANQTQTATSPKTPVPAVRSGVSAPTTGDYIGSSASTTAAPTTTPPSTEAPLTTGPGEGVAAAASSLEFGAKTTHAGERGPAKYRVTSTPRPTVPVLAPTYAPPRAPSPPPAPRAAASAEAGEEGGAGAESVQEESGDPYSTVSIQRGSVDPLPYAPPRDVHLVPLRVHKQPTQVIFIQPYAPTDLKQPPSAPEDAPPAHAPAHQPPFDTHRWVPVYVQEAYVPLLVEPRRRPHLHHLDAHHHHHQQQHHALPIAFSENRHTLGDFSSVGLQYPSEAWSWTSQQHSTPSSFSGESSISDRNYIR